MPAPSTAAETALALAREGAGHHQGGDLVNAERLYREALAIDPEQRNALNNLALIELARGNRAEGIQRLKRLVGLHPEFAIARNSLGSALLDDGQPDESLVHLQHAVRLQPAFPEAQNNLGIALHRSGQPDAALAAFDAALAARPGYAEAHANRGNLLRELGRLDEAEAALNAALALAPLLAAAESGLGCLYRERGDYEAAIRCCQRAVERSPAVPEFHKNLSLVLRKAGRLTDAIAAARRAIEIAPAYADAHFDLAQALLLAGDFADGWPEYDWRWGLSTRTQKPRQFGCPAWQGEPLAGKRLVIWPEQGPGDIVMFASCVPDVIAAGASVTLIAPARLVALLRRSFPAAAVIRDERQGVAPSGAATVAADYAVAIGSLPRRFRRRAADFARSVRYLVPDAQRVAAWRREFESLGPGRRIGISWRAGKTAFDARFRQSALPDWLGLLKQPGLTFVSLQYQPEPHELRAFEQTHGVRIHPGPDAAGDLDDFAAACDALDAVVAIAGTPVHFSGALGKPTWTIAPFAPDWRWQLGRGDSPWYPTMRLVRQGRNEPWADVVVRAAEAFMAWAKDKQRT